MTGKAAVRPEISAKERDYLRRLAERYVELASRPIEKEKAALWTAHNDLIPTRPLIFCDPENGWHEIITNDSLQCESALIRSWEYSLRRGIFWGEEMKDDRVNPLRFDINIAAHCTGWGLEAERIGGADGGSYVWQAPIRDYSELPQLHTPKWSVDWDQTEAVYELACDLFADLIPVTKRQSWWWSLGTTRVAAVLRGLENLMLDMSDHPAELHRLMTILMNGILEEITDLESRGLLYANTQDSYVGSGGFGWTNQLPSETPDGGARLKDMWGFCESQETVGISPKMFAEFVLPYQAPILEKFGLNCYGCCEPLDKRWKYVRELPKLRRISVSPWADLTFMAEQLGPNYVFSWKPNPSYLAMGCFDEAQIRNDLREGMEITRGCRVEIIMKDCHTIANEPERVKRWTQIAKEEAERIWSQ